jgi:PAS domain S-box-containing protein
MSVEIDRDVLAQAILNTSADAIIATGAEGHITYWNAGAERMFGFSQSEAIGQSLDIIIPERLRERHWSGFKNVMATGKSRYGEGDLLSVPGLRKDGQTISLEFTIVPLRGPGGDLVGMAAILRDVTRRFEELRALRRQVGSSRKDP